ncbi:MAG: glutamate formimidoyltransferase [Candidatus Eremiobacteraeota bacterium]|nr:glutamate formimidoyltransferase [Candidatus Eremiobacteraeota bacterium]MBC5827153.1 glutamate formimidoyltransferase [Candidatus Eremiobacteraeota bacterium]
MAKSFECVPNVSEGRRPDVISAIAQAAAGPDVVLIDTQSDASHNRSVFTLVGSGDGVLGAALRIVEAAVARIDLRSHSGEHPRMGAVDVIPFIPISESTMDDAILLARRCAQAVWERHRVPSYFYEFAATTPRRRDLSAVRQGQFEGLMSAVKDPSRHPDVGEPELHPSAGAMAIGARDFLIAYNVNLASGDLPLAQRIALAVRQRSGGFFGIKALGFALSDTMVQVSMNVVNVKAIPLYRVTEIIRREAAAAGVSVSGCELVGLTPLAAVTESAAYYLNLDSIGPGQTTW